MPADKIDVERLAREAAKYAQLTTFCRTDGLNDYRVRFEKTRDEQIIRLVLAEAKSVALSHTGYSDSTINDTAYSIAEEIEGLKP